MLAPLSCRHVVPANCSQQASDLCRLQAGRTPCVRRVAVQADIDAKEVYGSAPLETRQNPEEVTKKFGLEAGLWKAMTSSSSKDGKGSAQVAGELLKKYGAAYLITSISFAIISFASFYALFTVGVDVKGLLGQVGIQLGETGEQVSVVALAYAAHKAASPIRFPPTVALTPVVASWLGKARGQKGAATQESSDSEASSQ